jgi:hypothetical protein
MDIQLRFLESFDARGSDGQTYRVRGYERLVRDESLPAAVERWESTGLNEYRLDDGGFVDARPDGSLRVQRTGVTLSRN